MLLLRPIATGPRSRTSTKPIPALAIAHAGGRQVVVLVARLVGTRPFAIDGDEVLRVGVEEALHRRHVGVVERRDAPRTEAAQRLHPSNLNADAG
jgi:hypothetical protein